MWRPRRGPEPNRGHRHQGMVQSRLRRRRRRRGRSRWARHRRAGPRGLWAGLDTKVVGNLQDNSLKQLIGNLSNSVSGNLLSVREVDIDTQEDDRLCISRIMDILNGKGNQGHRHLRHRARPLGTTHLRR